MRLEQKTIFGPLLFVILGFNRIFILVSLLLSEAVRKYQWVLKSKKDCKKSLKEKILKEGQKWLNRVKQA